MPYPNEHTARITSPSAYVRFRRKNIAPGVDVIFGIRKDGKTEIQTYRFDAKRFTVAQAKAWLAEHNVKYILFEPAENREMNVRIRGQ